MQTKRCVCEGRCGSACHVACCLSSACLSVHQAEKEEEYQLQLVEYEIIEGLCVFGNQQ